MPAASLSLAAGASTVSTHPSSAAVLEAAREKNERPESVRHATYHHGLGVTGLTAGGERLAVGSRALLLREKVSVAIADTRRSSELEAEGRSVHAGGHGGHSSSAWSRCRTGFAPAPRAAVQRRAAARRSHRAGPAERRGTRGLPRPSVVRWTSTTFDPRSCLQDRGGEVRALSEGGHVVAVLGHPRADDGALGAAQVSVALEATGGTPGEWGVALASNDVRDAARALSIATESRDRTKVAIALGLAPGGVVALGIALGLAPLALARSSPSPASPLPSCTRECKSSARRPPRVSRTAGPASGC